MGQRHSQTDLCRGEHGGFPISIPLPGSLPRHIWQADVAMRLGSASQMGDEWRNRCMGLESCNFSLEICISRLIACASVSGGALQMAGPVP